MSVASVRPGRRRGRGLNASRALALSRAQPQPPSPILPFKDFKGPSDGEGLAGPWPAGALWEKVSREASRLAV